MAEAQPINSYSAVSVKADASTACAAVQNISGKRFLCGEAPPLPLAVCDRQGECQCKYEKWDDRRQEDRRFVIAGMANQYYGGDEKRRLQRGRRDTD